jgi:hypothetical membrane protein
LFVASVQYFLVQILVAGPFTPSYSAANNTISDLGNTHCAPWNGRLVCSPAHAWMNASFVLLGVTIILGSALIVPTFVRRQATRVGFALFALGGLGVVLVGVFPENTVSALHGFGATLPFLVGNVALVVLGWSLKVPGWLRLFTAISGTVALLALVVYTSGHTLGLGEGGIERVVAYPQTVWQIALGTYLLTARRAHRTLA